MIQETILILCIKCKFWVFGPQKCNQTQICANLINSSVQSLCKLDLLGLNCTYHHCFCLGSDQ